MKKLSIFLFINVLFSSLIAIKFFLVPGAALNSVGITFAIFAVLSQFFVFYLILSILCTPLYLLPKRVLNILLAVIFGAMQIILYADTITFAQYRFHINQSVLSLVLSGQVVDFSYATYLLMFSIVALVFFIELIVLIFIDSRIKKPTLSLHTKRKSKWLRRTTFFFILALIGTNVSYTISAYYAYAPIMVIKEYIPYYYPLTSKKIMRIFDKNGEAQNIKTNINFESNVLYPRKPLVIGENNKPYNIIFIVLDSWRYDTFTKEITPNTYEFVKQHNGIILDNHYSTGNATRTGIFGLFYGIPGTYWQSFFNSNIPSKFITTMQQENYDIGIFSSAKISAPEFDRTAFVTVKNLRISSKADTAPERDRELTQDWLNWFKNRDISRPSFSFLFYDAPHAYDFLKDIDLKFQPISDINYMTLDNNTDPTPVFNRYKNSVYSVDYLLQNVYSELTKSGTLDNTLIIITGDHAQEMNDNHMGFWGHNGNYTDAQTKVPFIVIGTKGENEVQLNENAKNNVLTSHEDVVPSLMKHYLGVENDIRDYSTGYDLFSPIVDRDWLLMSNYSTYAIRTPNNIYLVNSIGMSHYMDKHNKIINETPNYKFVHEALNNMKYFYDR